jgi:LytS/YehU family sensor histidine kinase
MKIRFGDALEAISIDVDPDLLHCRIPFMSLQTLIENAVKHNVVSREKPLKIKVFSQHDMIIVSNNLQLRKDVTDSGKQGLNYLKSTYAFFNKHDLRHGI